MGVAVTGLVLYVSSQIFIGQTYTEGLRTLAQMKQILFQKSLIIYLVTSVFVIGGIVMLTLFYSHRVAGPLYRLGVSAKTIASGDYMLRVRLRDGDVVHPLAESLNLLTERHRERLQLIRDKLKRVEEAAERLGSLSEGEGNGAFERALDHLSQTTEELKKTVGDIRL
ncbi:MAG: methyl-accepting chemotaxis protein [Nitrospirae bacterium]|nr:MAG: methyl-accepting chemotaxis protein [Nitrospirota bacterium]